MLTLRYFICHQKVTEIKTDASTRTFSTSNQTFHPEIRGEVSS